MELGLQAIAFAQSVIPMVTNRYMADLATPNDAENIGSGQRLGGADLAQFALNPHPHEIR